MSGIDQQHIEVEERGWEDPGDRFVCQDCVKDSFLAELLQPSLEASACDFCERRVSDGRSIGAPLRIVVKATAAALHRYWEMPENELPFESRDGGWQGEVLTTGDIPQNVAGWERVSTTGG